MSEWISVDEKLPDCDTEVLVYFGDPDIGLEIDYMDVEVDYGTQFWANVSGDEITHWMPLPGPPE